MATYMYRFGFKRFLLGYGSAVALVMLAICLVFSVAYMRLAAAEEYLAAGSKGPIMAQASLAPDEARPHANSRPGSFSTWSCR